MAALSRTTLVIVVVCASVVGLIALVIIIRLILRSRTRHAAAPLPPVQPLAHHRSTLYDSSLPYNSGRPTSTLSPAYSSSSAKEYEDLATSRLLPPIPTFPSSSESLHSSESNSPSSNGNPPSSRQRPPPRPLSQASFASYGNLSVSRRTSRNTLRGVPHAPQSQVQIVLPTPLALSPHYQQSTQSLRREYDSDPTSLVDRWVPVGRDDNLISKTSAPSTPRTSRRFSSPASPSSYTYTQTYTPPTPIPQVYTTPPVIERKNP